MTETHPHQNGDVAGFLLGTLEQDEVEAFAQHLADCVDCQAEMDELAHVSGLLVDVLPAVALPPAVRERTFAAIEAAARQAEAAPAGLSRDGPVAEPGEPLQAAEPAEHAGQVVALRPSRRPRRGPSTAWLAAAAAALIAIAAVGTLLAIRGRPSSVPLATIKLTAPSGGKATGVATVRAVSGGLSIEMTTDGLAVSPPGTMYTCWLVADGDTLVHPNRVSVGSFRVRSLGRVRVQWTTAADLRRFPHLGVTIEPENGNPSHQGRKVLTA